jgi:hypothetical protein
MPNSRFASAYYICNVFLVAAYAGAKLYHAHHGKTAYSMFKEDSFASWVGLKLPRRSLHNLTYDVPDMDSSCTQESQCRYSLVAIALMKVGRFSI